MPKAGTAKARVREIKRFLGYLVPIPGSECVEFVGYRDPKGYGRFRGPEVFPELKSKMAKAHRYAYVIFRGPIPKGMEPDHQCLNTSCANAYHLKLLTKSENTAKGNRDRTKEKPSAGEGQRTPERRGGKRLHRRPAGSQRARRAARKHHEGTGDGAKAEGAVDDVLDRAFNYIGREDGSEGNGS